MSKRSHVADRENSSFRSNEKKREKRNSKPSWVSKLVSFLPTIARLTTNNPMVQELADDVAVEVRNRDRMAEAAHEPHDNQQAQFPPRHSHRFPDHPQRGDARRPQPR